MGRECSRRGVALLRFRSGDEFLLVMNDMDEASGNRFLQNLARMLAATPFQIRGSDYWLSFSVGMRCLEISQQSELTDLNQVIESLLDDCEGRLATGKEPGDRHVH